MEHEVVDDELAAPGEQIGERYLPFRRVEDTSVLDTHSEALRSLRVVAF